MLRVPLLIAIALAVAFGIGIASAVQALKATVGFGAIALGSWVAFPQAQTADADPYAKAHRAREGRLLYGAAEGLRFTASLDESGAPLSSTCSYDIVGRTPPARFWTLFSVDPEENTLTSDPQLPGALNAWTILRRPDGSFVIHVSAAAQPDNWLAVGTAVPSKADRPSKTAGTFKLVLTLLDTPTAGSSGVIDLTMPRIVKTGCPDA